MKKILKSVFALLIFSFSVSGYSQVAEGEELADEEITLPDVSTVIRGGAIKVGKSAIPDYTEILPQNSEASGDFAVQLPDSGLQDAQVEKAEVKDKVSEKLIYVEGTAGCGVPGFFTGNFSIYRQTGNPFKIFFNHESSSGYARNSLNDGYFDRLTEISGEKSFATKTMKLDLSGIYSNAGDGLQSKSAVVADVSKENLSGNIAIDLDLARGFFFKAETGGRWYKRYGNLSGEAAVKDAIPTALKQVSILEIAPSFVFGWQSKGFSVDLDCGYQYEGDIYGSFDETRNLHRGQFGLDLGWKNDFVKVSGKGAVVLGNELNHNDVSVPFEAGVEFNFKTDLSPRNMQISLSGGCDSYLPFLSQNEEKYKFSVTNGFLSETSDWFGKFGFSLPLKDVFTFSFDSEFRKTAFDNGTWLPDYEEDSSLINSNFYGQYYFVQKDMTQVNTNAGVSMRFGIATISANWEACWGDKPALKYGNLLNAMISLQPESARFGLDGRFGIVTDSEEDNTPVIDCSVFFRVTSAVRLAVKADDIVKLIAGNSRTYAGQYIQRSGSAAFLVKFTF